MAKSTKNSKKTTTKKSATATKKVVKQAAKKTATKATSVPKASAKKTATKTATKAAAKNGNKTTTKKVAPKKGAAKNLMELLVDGLQDLYWAEKALYSKGLPKMLKNASDAELKKAIEDHMQETKNQVTRLESCFSAVGEKAKAKKCDAMQGLLDEGVSIVEETQIGAVRDAGIIAASQKIEHYEIASYGTLAAFAKTLGEQKCLDLLLETLGEEKKCDATLSAIGDRNLNSQAV